MSEKKLLITLFLFIFSIFGYSGFSSPGGGTSISAEFPDTSANPLIIGCRLHYGSIIVHSKSISALKNTYPWGIEIDISRHLLREKAWESCLCYPRAGFVFSYLNFDNPAILGYGLCASIYIEPFFNLPHTDKLSFSVKGVAGLSYLSQIYDSITNPFNQAYSLYSNGFLSLGICFSYRLNPNINLSFGTHFNHTSNGGIKEPNYGINFPSATAGIDYSFRPVEFKYRVKKKFRDVQTKQKRIDFILFTSYEEIYHGDKNFFIYGAGINGSRQVARISALTAGAEWIIDGVVKEEIRRQDTSYFSHHRGGILFGHEFLMGRFIYSQQLGVYFYRPYKDYPDPVYHRHQLIYKFNDFLYAGIGLKAHRHIADFVDVRIVITRHKHT